MHWWIYPAGLFVLLVLLALVKGPRKNRFKNGPGKTYDAIPPDSGGRSIVAFFVVRAWGRHGVGRAAAQELLRTLPGRWEIAFQDTNEGAARFWRQVVTDAVGSAWKEERRPVPGKSDVPPDTWLLLET